MPSKVPKSENRAFGRKVRTGTLTPFKQGDLDSLCGLYSILNAVRLLCPELDLHESRTLFNVLGETLTKERITAHETVSLGLEIPTLRAMIGAARRYVSEVLGVQLTSEPLQVNRHAPTIDHVWTTLVTRLRGGHVAILGLSGRHDHWTVARRGTRKTLRLFDSDDMKVLLRSKCSILSDRFPHQIDPEEITLLRRVERRL
jgi:hypothetical protein